MKMLSIVTDVALIAGVPTLLYLCLRAIRAAEAGLQQTRNQCKVGNERMDELLRSARNDAYLQGKLHTQAIAEKVEREQDARAAAAKGEDG